MEQTHNYSYERIKELCQEHFQEIAEREDIAYVLNNKRVRYVDPDCHFGYAKFGDFYFNRRGAMMLVTKDFPSPSIIVLTGWKTPCGAPCPYSLPASRPGCVIVTDR